MGQIQTAEMYDWLWLTRGHAHDLTTKVSNLRGSKDFFRVFFQTSHSLMVKLGKIHLDFNVLGRKLC